VSKPRPYPKPRTNPNQILSFKPGVKPMSKPRLSPKPRISPISTKKSHTWNQNIVIAYPTVTKYSKTLRTNRCIQWKRLWHFRYSISKSSSQRDWRNWSTSNTFPLVFW
jgi:hypothetical protein